MKGLSVGSDPEFFLKDKEGELVSSVGLLGGTKDNPRQTPHGYVQEDNVTAEVNSTPSVSKLEFITNHQLILKDLEDILTPLNLSVDISGSAIFKDELLSHPQALKSGCLPDFNAWEMCENEEVNYMTTNVRAAGGHLHISSPSMITPMDRVRFCRALDMELALPSVIHDEDSLRRELYGKAGAFRFKMKENDGYDGLEYRTLSNYWMKNESLMGFVYDKISMIHSNLDFYATKAEELHADLVSIINTGAKQEAVSLCKQEGIKYAY